MNNTSAKAGILVLYILLLSKIIGFKIWLIINVPFLIMVVSGTLLLAFLSYHKETGKKGVLDKLKVMALVSGSLITFLANIALTSKNIGNATEIYTNAVNNFLPLFYGFLIYFVLDLIKITNPGDVELNTIESVSADIEKLEDYDLTRREIAVSQEILMKLSNGEIAEKLYISENTVKKHVNHIFQKVGVSNRTEFILKFTINQKDLEREDIGH